MLSQLKILDFTQLLPGPFATMLLADLGAEVIRVEPPTGTDLVRIMGPQLDDGPAYHLALNRNKKSIAIDLKTQRGVELVRRMLRHFDVLVEGFRPGTMKSLGLDYNSLKEEYPQLIYCSLSGYGQQSSKAKEAGHDINYLAISGVSSHSGSDAHGPFLNGVQIADQSGAMYLVISMLSAYISRLRTNKGQYIDIAMTDCVINLQQFAVMEALFGNGPSYESDLLNGGSYYNYYRTKDNRFVSVGSLEPKFYMKLVSQLPSEELKQLDPRKDSQEVRKVLQEIFLTKTLKEWRTIFDGVDACVEPVLTVREMLASEYVQSRGILGSLPQSNISIVGYPAKFSDFSPVLSHGGTDRGENGREILEELGIADYDEYRSKDIVL